ncbi:MAG: EI24 domain-containing protein [Bdellovibrionales bacterium]|nr:EI24 domain-containing protein [Bdellovibrionales bacterium]
MDSKFKDFLKGIVTPIRAVGVIFSSPKLLTLSALPILTTCVVLAVVFYALMAGLWSYVAAHFTGYFAQYQSGLMVAFAAVAGIMFIYVAINSVAILISFFSSPFNDILAEATERSMGVPEVPGFTVGRALRILALDFRKTLLALILSLSLSLGLLIPFVGILAFLAIALLNTFTFVTYPQSRRLFGVRSSFKWVLRNVPLSMGFGLTTTFLFSIPVINIFALPISVVGGTLLFLESTPGIPHRSETP